jgi:hypothetical protein
MTPPPEFLPAGTGSSAIEHEIEHPFAEGDIVTHSLGGGLFRVVGMNWAGDLVDVECIEAPPSAWCAVGFRESNLARRYSLETKVRDR